MPKQLTLDEIIEQVQKEGKKKCICCGEYYYHLLEGWYCSKECKDKFPF